MPLTRAELLEALTQSREATEAILAGLSAEQLTAPNAIGDWSIKDILAHITAWEVELLTTLGKARRGQKPGRVDWDSAAIEAQNRKWHAQYTTRDLGSVLADFDGVRQQTLRLVQGLSEADVLAPLKWWRARPLSECIFQWSVEHEREHEEELVAWRKSQAPAQDDGPVSQNGSHGPG